MLDRLAALPDLAGVPRDQLRWLLDHGRVVRVEDGTRYFGTEEGLRGLFLVISGSFSVRVALDGVEREVREVTPGRPTAYLPYSKMVAPRGYLVANGPVEFLVIQVEDLPEMTRHCYDFTAICVQEMLARVRVFKGEDKRLEKMAALGRLSAGVAHELNNPASAAARAARELDAARAELVTAVRGLGEAGLEGEAAEALRRLESVAPDPSAPPLSALERSEREEELLDWLDARGADGRWAVPLVERGLRVADLDAAAESLGAERLEPVLRFLAADRVVTGLCAEIAAATGRIHSLVAAVKTHTHMDRAPVTEPIRIEAHLADTVVLLSGKAALKGVTIDVRIDGDLPPVRASVVDLNQVWLHLLDNAIDAVAESGRVVVEACRDGSCVVVRVVDDGPGIPEELREKVFEPFFTTKDVGAGRGLGLDIVRTVVDAHRGAVELSSVPGRTELRVTLPACETEATGG